ncbi:hypothetical protein FOPG_16551 [Fusarium oxysporum f. sp. conglutinans race 2 54008]|uniref:Uncharacterized protein n=2 Tax=Fusarium oxysporum f. sp. conglutinans TaxID=100902 RepID=F9FZ79_FUSOF|nr:hypothetical protein FOXB_11711 [Fusarium oxysporum f. sp. conglutinans Fo5176]EXL67318.1 hypothetical protein FOPG_16551 [Fusarium oxysporum f. sp. conglutinans race 2 54008]
MQHSDSEWASLCHKVKGLLPEDIGKKAWYLVIFATLAVSPETSLPASFYTYLKENEPGCSSEASLDYLGQRFRDVLLKQLSLVGGPQVLSVLIPLAKAEGDIESKAKSSSLNEKWFVSSVSSLSEYLSNGLSRRRADKMNVPAIYNRGLQTINTIYGEELLKKIFNTWGSHKEDVKFNEVYTLYGLWLSDFEVLTPLETEAVVYSSISCLGLGGPGNWHLRGMGRLLGAKGKDDASEEMQEILQKLMNLKEAVVSVVHFVGQEFVNKAKLDKWADATSVSRDLGGWGN